MITQSFWAQMCQYNNRFPPKNCQKNNMDNESLSIQK